MLQTVHFELRGVSRKLSMSEHEVQVSYRPKIISSLYSILPRSTRSSTFAPCCSLLVCPENSRQKFALSLSQLDFLANFSVAVRQMITRGALTRHFMALGLILEIDLLWGTCCSVSSGCRTRLALIVKMCSNFCERTTAQHVQLSGPPEGLFNRWVCENSMDL